MTNVDSLGAFAVADVVFLVVHAKWTAHLLLQEYMLEMGSKAILYKAPI